MLNDYKLESLSPIDLKRIFTALIELGYQITELPELSNVKYLYAQGANGLIRGEIDTALASEEFAASTYEQISIEELLETAHRYENEKLDYNKKIITKERPLFEENFISNGGNLEFIKWEKCTNGTGDYQPDWDKISLINHDDTLSEHTFNENIIAHAQHVKSCLMTWVECAKSKEIPKGYYVMPLQPTEDMLLMAQKEFDDLGLGSVNDLQDRIVFAHQAMINILAQKAKATAN